MKHKHKKHTGNIFEGMHGKVPTNTKRDKAAHPSHHEMNKEHGTPMGFCPPDGPCCGSMEDKSGEGSGEGESE